MPAHPHGARMERRVRPLCRFGTRRRVRGLRGHRLCTCGTAHFLTVHPRNVLRANTFRGRTVDNRRVPKLHGRCAVPEAAHTLFFGTIRNCTVDASFRTPCKSGLCAFWTCAEDALSAFWIVGPHAPCIPDVHGVFHTLYAPRGLRGRTARFRPYGDTAGSVCGPVRRTARGASRLTVPTTSGVGRF